MVKGYAVVLDIHDLRDEEVSTETVISESYAACSRPFLYPTISINLSYSKTCSLPYPPTKY